jgi:hypothetical protein
MKSRDSINEFSGSTSGHLDDLITAKLPEYFVAVKELPSNKFSV